LEALNQHGNLNGCRGNLNCCQNKISDNLNFELRGKACGAVMHVALEPSSFKDDGV